ncbi:hypothetical protein ACOME3_009414 [Neoechinorhynchus agilis]
MATNKQSNDIEKRKPITEEKTEYSEYRDILIIITIMLIVLLIAAIVLMGQKLKRGWKELFFGG